MQHKTVYIFVSSTLIFLSAMGASVSCPVIFELFDVAFVGHVPVTFLFKDVMSNPVC